MYKGKYPEELVASQQIARDDVIAGTEKGVNPPETLNGLSQ